MYENIFLCVLLIATITRLSLFLFCFAKDNFAAGLEQRQNSFHGYYGSLHHECLSQ